MFDPFFAFHVIINFADKFDQFWAVNRRLMEPSAGEEGFKHLPLRMFKRDKQMVQRLYRTVAAEGDDKKRRKRTLRDLLAEAMPEQDPEKGDRR